MAEENPPILVTRGLTKRFGRLVAVDHVDFELRRGEIHCLFGENGAGKSTFAACVNGFLQPDDGEILFKGRPVSFASAAEAIRLGIGMVHQHFVLVPEFTVLENVMVGSQPDGIFLRTDEAEARFSGICRAYGIDLDPHARIRDLSVGQQQWVEIIKALYLRAEVLILDEPSSALGPEESRVLFAMIARMRAEGLSVILISHKLDEVMQSDRVTVLRRGARVGTVNAADTSPRELTTMMVGRDVSLTVERPEQVMLGTMLEVRNLTVRGDRGDRAVDNVSFEIRRGEVLGLAGVAGNGQKELFDALAGARPVESGEIWLDGEEITGLDGRGRIRRGVGHVPDDRFLEGLVPAFTIAENLILGSQREAKFRSGPLLNWKAVRNHARERMKTFQIAAPSEASPTENLSGGNAQRVILAREIERCSRLLLANQPTRGLDVGVIEYVYDQLLRERSAGLAILLASSELEDLIGISDRIAVIYKGRILDIVDPRAATIEEIGLLMAGHSANRERATA